MEADVRVKVSSGSQDVQLADLESTVYLSSCFCEGRDEIDTSVWQSPEAQFGLQWGPPTDIWSFGTTVRLSYSIFLISIGDVYLIILTTVLIRDISLIWGDNFLIFNPMFLVLTMYINWRYSPSTILTLGLFRRHIPVSLIRELWGHFHIL